MFCQRWLCYSCQLQTENAQPFLEAMADMRKSRLYGSWRAVDCVGVQYIYAGNQIQQCANCDKGQSMILSACSVWVLLFTFYDQWHPYKCQNRACQNIHVLICMLVLLLCSITDVDVFRAFTFLTVVIIWCTKYFSCRRWLTSYLV